MKSLKIVVLYIIFSLGYCISAQTVYTTKTGEKYHKSNCHYLKYSKKEIKLDKAKALGFSACKVCKPTESNTKKKSNNTSLTSKKESKTATSKKVVASQCTGKTKAGKQCKRKTKNASGRCYQH
ncbi:hypothetical protein [Winogradskyella luteola]|uniref:Ada DNA repair metal-binding domain-containing protein n=1 Tax=Winogradskyella luteola TaxID=2828330 RepID=A0A9X1F6H6_9FLAO|nr:hypothetical protein [Winogradskyella luteola]MBV7268026.1 hypothetical protein [Winogradskyella luteola]